MKKCSVLLAFLLFLCLLPLSACAGEAERTLYRAQLSYADGELSFSVDVTFTSDGAEEVFFDLPANVYAEGGAPVSDYLMGRAYYVGREYGGVQLDSVSPCSDWSLEDTVLRVSIGPHAAGERVTLRLEGCVKLVRINHRAGISEGGVNLGNVLPVLRPADAGDAGNCPWGDPFYSECADYEVSIEADASYAVAASCEAEKSETKGGRRTTFFRAENVRDFALCLLEGAQVLEEKAAGVTLRYYFYEGEGEEVLGAACEAVEFFSDAFGDLPFSHYTLVQTGFSAGGMEYPGLCMLSLRNAGREAVYTAVHETAHQWWYAAVGNDERTHAWMDEGLAEFSCNLFFEAHPEYGFSRAQALSQAKGAVRALCTVEEQLSGSADTSVDRPLSAFSSEYEYVVMTYAKGMLLFEAVQDFAGESATLRALSRYYEKYRNKVAEPEDLLSMLPGGGAQIARGFLDGSAAV